MVEIPTRGGWPRLKADGLFRLAGFLIKIRGALIQVEFGFTVLSKWAQMHEMPYRRVLACVSVAMGPKSGQSAGVGHFGGTALGLFHNLL
jgi:hypothetical protein